MLEELHARDLALIEDVWLEFGPGLTVLTGETGAGKTVLVGALKLLLGERADPQAVRGGAEEAVVEGRFALPDGGERVARRRVASEGRSRCYMDGGITTVSSLADELGPLVDLHGQHEHQALLRPAGHAAYLDRYGTPPEVLECYACTFASLTEVRDALRDIVDALADRERTADHLRFQVADIDAVAPKPGEDETLESLLPRLRHGERLATAAAAAHSALRDDGAASDRLAAALAPLAAVAGIDPALDALADRIARAADEVDAAGAELREHGEAVEYDPRVLDDVEGRLAALSSLKRKYGPTLADVLAVRDSAVSRLEELEDADAGLERARAAAEDAEAVLREAGEGVSLARKASAPLFAEQVTLALADLAMPSARFETAVEPLPFEEWGADGPDRVEFMFVPGSGEEARPLTRIASGGEISRVMLALKGVLGAADTTPVLVFDEVDTGVGGATALAVGRRLAALAERRQVLVVTHLAQVAAYADEHVVVEREEREGRTVTGARRLEGEERVAEVARMLSGSGTGKGFAHARELLDAAVAEKASRDQCPAESA